MNPGYLGNNDVIKELCTQSIHSAERKLQTSERSDTELLVIGVGSSITKANEDIAALTRYLWERTAYTNASYGFISKMTFPSVEDSFKCILNHPSKNIIVLPLILFPGMYLKSIITKIDNIKQTTNKHIEIASCLNSMELSGAVAYRINEVISTKVNFAENIPSQLQSRKLTSSC